jgi:hypothetical protein
MCENCVYYSAMWSSFVGWAANQTIVRNISYTGQWGVFAVVLIILRSSRHSKIIQSLMVGVLRTVYRIKKLKMLPRPTKSCKSKAIPLTGREGL